jgi:WD40 repeat protein
MVVLNGHEAPVLSVCFSPDGTRLASGDAEGAIFLWDPTDGRQLSRSVIPSQTSIDVLAFGRRGQSLAAAGTGSEVYLWDLKT